MSSGVTNGTIDFSHIRLRLNSITSRSLCRTGHWLLNFLYMTVRPAFFSLIRAMRVSLRQLGKRHP